MEEVVSTSDRAPDQTHAVVPSVKIDQPIKRVRFDIPDLPPRPSKTPLKLYDQRIVYSLAEKNLDAYDRARCRKQQWRGDFEANSHVTYKVSQHQSRSERGSLVDRGANGGIIGNDARIIHTYVHAKVDVTGIDNHELSSLKVVDAISTTESQKVPHWSSCADVPTME